MSRFKAGERYIWDSNRYGIPRGTRVTIIEAEDGNGFPWVDGESVGAEYKKCCVLPQELKEITMNNLQQGDVLVNGGYDYDRIVHGMISDIVFTTDSDDGTIRFATVSNLKDDGWGLKTDEPEPQEVTLDEVAKAMNIPVEQLRIKKES